MIHGVGIEIVDIERFRLVMERGGQRFLERLFTRSELDYCMRQRRPHEHLAARFAAKVSVIKAAGAALSLRVRDIEVVRGAGNRPEVRVTGLCTGFTVAVSISHDGGLGVAQAIIEMQG
ncbi:MAG: holo-ACP synthase [Deltaproteobacteria bacterium]|nr:holo-ACP synthase [Deltaproteobacteria bacterium]